jgi:hypothetical protein
LFAGSYFLELKIPGKSATVKGLEKTARAFVRSSLATIYPGKKYPEDCYGDSNCEKIAQLKPGIRPKRTIGGAAKLSARRRKA